MTHVTIDAGAITEDEMRVLTIGQVAIVAAFRQLRTARNVARFFGREEVTIRMAVTRIRKLGVTI
jgi:hypothetical protein